MLVRITNHCRMCCSHCMVNAGPEGEHMPSTLFEPVIRFVRKACLPEMILLSGGEPTDHPELVDFLELCKKADVGVMLLSNGMFLHEDEKRRGVVLDLVSGVQVTNDTRFYPKDVPDFDHPKVKFERMIRMVSPFGRALNTVESARQSPLCFNLRSLVRSGLSLSAAMLTLTRYGRFCTPSVNVDGSIAAGEAPSCSTFGTVKDSENDLTEALVSLTCQRCGLVGKLTHEQKFAIGESLIAPP